MKKILAAILVSMSLWAPPAAAQTCTEQQLEVATLNTWGLPYPLSRQRGARFEQIRSWLDSGIDIIGLQEVWSSARSLLPTRLRVPGTAADSGLAVVTPHPSTQPSLTPFDSARGFDALKTKGVLTTKVGLPDGGATWVAVTHMQAGHSRSSAAVRADQVRQLLDVVDSLDGPALVMGDFNLYDDLDEDIASARLLGDRGYTDVALQSGALDPTYRTGTERLDRIYARSGPRTDLRGFEARVGRRKSLSDHLPVEARVRLCRAPVAAHSASDAGIRSAGPLAPLRTP